MAYMEIARGSLRFHCTTQTYPKPTAHESFKRYFKGKNPKTRLLSQFSKHPRRTTCIPPSLRRKREMGKTVPTQGEDISAKSSFHAFFTTIKDGGKFATEVEERKLLSVPDPPEKNEWDSLLHKS